MNDYRNRALSLFASGSNCAQSVLGAFAAELGLETERALRLAAGFGAGMGRLQLTCGAVTGAFMALGLRYGAGETPDPQAKARCYERIREFAERFTFRHGTLGCRELIGVDIGTAEGSARARQLGIFETKCRTFVGDAAEILGEMLEAHRA